MCSLFGWIDYKGIVPHKVLEKLTQALANAAEERGTDAAGISYVKKGKVTIYKRPKPAHKLRFKLPTDTVAVMGHTRMATQGDRSHNYNNHPFYGHADIDFAFAHNGVLYNDTELRRDKHLPDTHIETDSYIAVQLIEQKGTLDFDTLAYMAESVRGNFTFTVLDESNILYIVKGSNPMCLLHFESIGIYVYASTESIMKKALKKIGWQVFPFNKIDVDEGEIIKMDSKGIISREEFEVQHYTRYPHWYDYYNESAYDYYSMHEQLLLTYCNFYGVDTADVEMLLEYGYTCDEIEDMLADNELLHETICAVKGEEEYSENLLEVF